tara:strand:+ start:1251 stop:1616 length:366 start_codon:yes stop_codon:yes gene_type:complete
MKPEKTLKTLLLILITSLFFFACSNDDPVPGCYQESGRKIVATINNVKGEIIEKEFCGFIIRPDERLDNNPIGILSPCNLDNEFEVDGAKVVFSGYIYESFDTEDICADFFEITEIRLSNP